MLFLLLLIHLCSFNLNFGLVSSCPIFSQGNSQSTIFETKRPQVETKGPEFQGEKPFTETKILICGVGQNVDAASSFTIKNIETLGKKFPDYRVIIYENNSSDKTVHTYSAWAKRNPRVNFLTEVIPFDKMPRGRTAKIARARNSLLKEASLPQYDGFDVVVMVDLDFITPWPIIEIVQAISMPIEWDCISANGIDKQGKYYDRLALRTKDYPFGPELLGDMLWRDEVNSRVDFRGERLIPVFSAFGGLCIYKKKTLLSFLYSGKVTEAVREYYQLIIEATPPTNPQLRNYLSLQKIKPSTPLSKIIPIFSNTQCCEHLTLHAEMALEGHGKFFIYPDMVMRY